MQTNSHNISNVNTKIEPLCISQKQMVIVGRFGKSVGLKGAMRIGILTDFPEILSKNTHFYVLYTKHIIPLSHIFNASSIKMDKEKEVQSEADKKSFYFPITLRNFNFTSNVIQLNEITKREEALVLCNTLFFSTIDDTRTMCALSKDEFFYFDIIGMSVVDNGVEIGVVKDIQKIANTHYFLIDKHFMIPYIDRYVLDINLQNRQIITKDAIFLRM